MLAHCLARAVTEDQRGIEKAVEAYGPKAAISQFADISTLTLMPRYAFDESRRSSSLSCGKGNRSDDQEHANAVAALHAA
jgi:hypothetical protein